MIKTDCRTFYGGLVYGVVMKKSSKKKLIIGIIIAVIVIAGFIPFYPYLYMRFNILRNMKKVYKDANFVHFSCDSKPIPDDHLDGYIWYGGEEPEGPLYAFLIEDSEGRNGWGYANKDGKVILDNYAGEYYLQDTIDYFERVVDFRNNFPELRCTPIHTSPINKRRLVYTEDCATFEGYMKTRLVGSSSFSVMGFSGIAVGLNTTDEKCIYDINQILREADFEVCVEYMTTDEKVTDEKTKGIGNDLGKYYPFGDETYETIVLGDMSRYDRLKEKNEMLLSVDVTEGDTSVKNYTLYVDGTLIIKDQVNKSEEKKEISEDDVIRLNACAWGSFRDITGAKLLDDQENDRNIKVSLYFYVTGNDGDKTHYEQKEHYIDNHNEQLQKVVDMIESY